MNRSKSSHTSIDNLARNLINAKCNSLNKSLGIQSNDNDSGGGINDLIKKKKLMSSMNDQEFDGQTAQITSNGQLPNQLTNKQLNGACSPSSPSSLSSSSSTSSSSSSSTTSAQQQQQAAIAAALQALLQQNGGSANTQQQQALAAATAALLQQQQQPKQNQQSLKDLAKLNLDVKNFKLQDSIQNSQLLMQQQQQQFNLNNLIAAATAAAGPNAANNNLLLQSQHLDINMHQRKQQPKQAKQQGQQRKSSKYEGDVDLDEQTAMMAAAAATLGNIGLNTNLKHKKKGNSVSPSPSHGTSASDDAETQSPLHGSPKSESIIPGDAYLQHFQAGRMTSTSSSGISSGASASGSTSSVDENRRNRRRPNKVKNQGIKIEEDDMLENDCDDLDDSRSSPTQSNHSPHSLNTNDQNGQHENYENPLLIDDVNGNVTNNNDLENTNGHLDDDDDDDDDDEGDDDLDESNFESSINKKARLNGQNGSSTVPGSSGSNRARNHSTSSPTRSTSSTPQSRSMSPSSAYRDSPAAFPNLSTVSNGLDSNALLAATSLLQTPGLSFPGLSPVAAAALSAVNTPTNAILSARKRRTDREAMSERVKKIKPVPNEKKDEAYWERRRKNNEAAKRSRDLRRQKEDEIALRASFLEQENLKLKAQVNILKAELSKLHMMLYQNR